MNDWFVPAFLLLTLMTLNAYTFYFLGRLVEASRTREMLKELKQIADDTLERLKKARSDNEDQ